MKTGDIVIQIGTRHAWHNKTDQPCVMAVSLVGSTARPDPTSTAIRDSRRQIWPIGTFDYDHTADEEPLRNRRSPRDPRGTERCPRTRGESARPKRHQTPAMGRARCAYLRLMGDATLRA